MPALAGMQVGTQKQRFNNLAGYPSPYPDTFGFFQVKACGMAKHWPSPHLRLAR